MENIPSVDPADLDSLAGAFQFIVKKILQQTDDGIPAKVIAYDRTTGLATLQPMIKILTTNNTLVSRAPIAKVPVFSYGGGGFTVNFPLVAGDTGWIKANDRDISLYLQSAYEESPPNTDRIHSFSDGVFYPDVMAKYTIAAEDAANMVIQTLDGTVKISIGTDIITVVAPTGVMIETPQTYLGGDLEVLALFGCNGASPQAPFTVDLATGANNTTVINQIRQALINNGIAI